MLGLLQSCRLVQSVVGPTHTHGNTLDLVITRSDLPRPAIIVDLPQVTDHSLIHISRTKSSFSGSIPKYGGMGGARALV